jgi:hypothetical protein
MNILAVGERGGRANRPAARSGAANRGIYFGLMTDDYTPKPAFHSYRDLIDALSR